MPILSMGCTRGCFDAQQGWHRGGEWSGASSSHAFLQKTLPRSKCSCVRAELTGGTEPLMRPTERRTRQGDGPILTLGTAAEPTGGYRWRTVTAEPPWPPSWGGHPKHPPSAEGLMLDLVISWMLYKSPRAGSVAGVSLGGAATLLASQLLGSGPSACKRTAGKTQNNMYQESALGELISNRTWLWIAQHT